MIRKLSLATIVPLVCVFSAVAAEVSSQPTATLIPAVPVTGKIQWVYGYAEGQKLAGKTGKPMFVVFRCER